MSYPRRAVFGILLGASLFATALAVAASPWVSRANTPPRKVVVATTVVDITGSVDARLKLIAGLIDEAASRSATDHPGKGLDLVVFPEFALCRETGTTASERAVRLSGVVADTLGAKAREHHTWLLVPMTLREEGITGRLSNAAVLFDRMGNLAGIFRKVHPIADGHGVFEGGVAPGEGYPVFDCDFGKLGILICWDMSYEEGWDALGAAGAEIVALPSASPQSLRPSAEALRHRYFVVNSAPRDNASVFDPLGRTVAQVTSAPGVLVHEIDLSYAILHWSETLQQGRALTERFGPAAVGGTYSTREDTGLFWSNDPKRSIGTMIRDLGLIEMPEMMEQMEEARRKAAKDRR